MYGYTNRMENMNTKPGTAPCKLIGELVIRKANPISNANEKPSIAVKTKLNQGLKYFLLEKTAEVIETRA